VSGLITQRSVVQIHPPQPTVSNHLHQLVKIARERISFPCSVPFVSVSESLLLMLLSYSQAAVCLPPIHWRGVWSSRMQIRSDSWSFQHPNGASVSAAHRSASLSRPRASDMCAGRHTSRDSGCQSSALQGADDRPSENRHGRTCRYPGLEKTTDQRYQGTALSAAQLGLGVISPLIPQVSPGNAAKDHTFIGTAEVNASTAKVRLVQIAERLSAFLRATLRRL
jgi:hypothetical protein